MRTMISTVYSAALVTLVACDPDVGSLTDCEPAAPAVDVNSIADDVPSTVDAELQAWLVAGSYSTFLPESAAHASAGPHGGRVRTFVNRQLAGSLTTCEPSHPVGAAAVKELFDGNGIRGWAVMIKTRPGPGADAWYWYEVFSTAIDAEPAVSAQASGTCVGCHDGGLDAVRSRWPLR